MAVSFCDRRPEPRRATLPARMDRVGTVYSEALPPSDGRLRCQLVVIDGPDHGRAVRLGDRELTVGSDPGCDLVLADDRVSAQHLAIRPAEGRFVVRDLDSRNGTLYEGSRLSELTVPVGATFKLGRSFLRIQPLPQPLEVQPSQARRYGDLVGDSLTMREVFAVLELAAGSDVTVLLEGETGTGKELAARAIHDGSARRKGPFVAVDCGALPATLLESELWGHVRGAFTGASQSRAGVFVRASGGTIFLDELSGIPAAVQARLLRVLEERMVRPVGADDERQVDVRVIAAARDDLEARAAAGDFRADLYYRLSVLRVALPPLRARREDIGPIVAELLRRRGLAAGRLDGANLDRLMAHGWPGNVRELRNVIERAIALSPGARTFADLRLAVAPVVDGPDPLAVRADLPYSEAKEAILHAFERRYLADAFAAAGGNLSATARATGIDRKHLRALLRRHELIAAAASSDEPDGGT
jgi:DNA-binding NtrC family response regulator